MSEKPLSILISGAGIAGSSLALMLLRHPAFKLKPIITLVERASEPRITGQAIDIRGPAVDVIRHLGLEQKIKDRHTSEVGIAFVNAKGGTIAHLDATGDVHNQSGTSEFEILRGELAGLLLEDIDAARVTTGQEVNVVYGESIQSLREHDDGVAVEFAQGKIENSKFDVVVAADGYTSTTRTKIFGEASESPVKPMGMYIAFFTIPRIPGDDDFWRWYTAPGGLAIHLRPHRNKTTMGVYLTITGPSRQRFSEVEDMLAKGADAQKTMLRARFQHLGWQTKRFLDGLDASDDLYMQSVAMVRTPQWTKGRCAIVGDSAFAMMGFGTSFAMIGAYTIAGELAKITSNTSAHVATALKRYEDIFRPLVAKYEKTPPFFPQMANPQTKWGVSTLQTMLKVVFWLRLPQLLQWALSGESKESWKLPDYGYQPQQAKGEK